MAFADLGVRIVLEDGARAGFNALGLSIFHVYTRLGALHQAWAKLPPQIKAAGIAAGVTGLIFGGLSDFLWQCIDAASQLQQEMANLDVSVNGASDAGNALTDTLVSVADHSIYTTAVIADGFTTLGVDGWNAQQLISGMGEAMVTFAEASRTDVVPAANLLGTVMETYGANANEARQYTNDLTFALYNGQKTVSNMQTAFNQAGATAHGLKIPFGELSDALALLGEDGLKGNMAGSALRYMLTSLADPTIKAQKELSALGIIVVHTNVPAFDQLRARLEASGGAAAKAANNYDGTVTSLQKMFTEAQKVGVIHTDQSFYQWAIASGILTDKLYDANGNFIGIKGSIEQLGSAIDKMNPQQKAMAIQQIFNVRGAQAAKLLLDNYQLTLDKFGNLDLIRRNTDAQKKAADVTNTLSADMARLGSTWQDVKARLGKVNLGPLQNAFNFISDLMDKFNTAPESTRNFVGQLLVMATAISGLIFVGSAIIFIVGAFGSAIGLVLLVIAGLAVNIGEIIGLFFAFKNALASNKGVADLFKNVMGILGGLLHNLGEQFQNLMRSLKLLEPVWNVLKVVLMVIAGILVGVILLAVGLVIGVFIALTWTINLVIQILSRVGSFFGMVFGMIGKYVQNIPNQFHQAWNTALTIIQLVVNNIRMRVMAFVVGIQTIIHNGFELVKKKIHDAINFVVGLFSWLYNHNYYFALLVNIIKAKIHEIQRKFTEVKNFITGLWKLLWDTVQAKVAEVWKNVTNRFTQAKKDTTNKFNEIKAAVTIVWHALWNAVTSKVHEAWNNVTNAFNNAKGMVTGKINDIKNNILNPIKNLGQQLFDSAKNAIQMFINGIKSMAGNVGKAAGDIAGQIAHALGFHSPPKGGPLADSDTYMPNMMKMYARGINAHKHLVGDAAAGVAAHIGKSLGAISPTVGIHSVGSVMTSAMMSASQSGQAGGINQTLTIPLVVDGKTVSTVVLQQIGHELKVNGVGRTLR